ncbi:long-chain-alcohol oxidase [Sarracenia purpurea var. burkii]
MEDRRRESYPHPLLRGRRKELRRYSHGFSSSQIGTLSSACEAIFPPLPFHPLTQEHPPNHPLHSFYQLSGSNPPFPDEAAELFMKLGSHAKMLVSLVLRILSTRLGTLLLCGFHCFSWRWPFIHKFSEMSLEKRERMLQRWSRQSKFFPLRVTVHVFKVLCCSTLFTLVI